MPVFSLLPNLVEEKPLYTDWSKYVYTFNIVMLILQLVFIVSLHS